MRTAFVSSEIACILATMGDAFVKGHQYELSAELHQLKDNLVKEINRRGFVIVQGLKGEPEKSLLALAALVGTVGIPVDELDAGPLIMDLKPEFQKEISSRSASAFDLHTDLSYVETPPDLITTLCIQPDRGGNGRTIISDTRSCLADLSKNSVEELRKPQFTFSVPPRCREGVLAEVPIITVDRNGEPHIRIRFDKVIAPSDTAASAIDELYHTLHMHKKEFLLKKSSAYIIDNRRMVHGRTALGFGGSGTERHLKRVYGMRRLRPATTITSPS